MTKFLILKLKKSNLQKGVTLIELLLYISILTIILSALVPFAWNSIGTGVKASVQQEVNSNARYISERIKYEIRNSTGITTPAVGASGNSLVLTTSTPPTSPTTIDLLAGDIRIQQGSGSTINLNSINTTVTSLIFTSFTSGDGKTKHVKFVINLAAKYGVARKEYQDSILIEGSAEVRSN